MDDDQIYCSELIYKAYQTASGQQLGRLARLRDLNWRPYEATIAYFEKGPAPLDREMITPKDMARCGQLTPVYSYALKIEQE